MFCYAARGKEPIIYADCQLTSGCVGRTTDDLANERSTTPSIIDRETTQTTLSVSNNTTSSATQTGVSMRRTTSTKATCNTNSKQDSNTTPYGEMPISRAQQQLTKTTSSRKYETLRAISEGEKPSTVGLVKTTKDALKSTGASKRTEGTDLISIQTD